MLGAVRKGKKADMLRLPFVESLHDRSHQLLGDALIPKIGMDDQRAKVADGAPIHGKIRSDNLSARFSREGAKGSMRQRALT